MREDRLDNAVAALDILARADSSAFAHGRSDASASNWRASYVTKDGTPRTVTVMALDAAGAARLVSNLRDFDHATGEPTALRNDAVPGGGVACTFILVDGSVDQVIPHTGAWQSIVAREVRDLKAMDCGRVTTKEYANESVGYARHDSVRKDEAPDTADTQWKVTYKIGSNPEQSVTVKASNADAAEEAAKRTSTGSRFLWGDVVSVKRV